MKKEKTYAVINVSVCMLDHFKNLGNPDREVNTLERGNRRQLLTRGEVSAERKERLDRLLLEKEKLIANTTQMAEAVSECMVELPVLQSEKDEEEEAELAAEVGLPTTYFKKLN